MLAGFTYFGPPTFTEAVSLALLVHVLWVLECKRIVVLPEASPAPVLILETSLVNQVRKPQIQYIDHDSALHRAKIHRVPSPVVS
jgi:hypothetical protein